jgi:hypothetical protein
MNLPDVNAMSGDQVVRWITVALLVFLLGSLYTELQARAVEHKQLMMVGQVQCVNDAERVSERAVRALQLRRCLTLTVEPIEVGGALPVYPTPSGLR